MVSSISGGNQLFRPSQSMAANNNQPINQRIAPGEPNPNGRKPHPQHPHRPQGNDEMMDGMKQMMQMMQELLKMFFSDKAGGQTQYPQADQTANSGSYDQGSGGKCSSYQKSGYGMSYGGYGDTAASAPTTLAAPQALAAPVVNAAPAVAPVVAATPKKQSNAELAAVLGRG